MTVLPVEGESFDMYGSDPVVRVAVDTLGQEGDAFNVGRARRLATDTQRRAPKVRDGGCARSLCARSLCARSLCARPRCDGPGCDMPVDWTELHSAQHW